MYTYKKTITTEYDLDNLIEVDVNETGGIVTIPIVDNIGSLQFDVKFVNKKLIEGKNEKYKISLKIIKEKGEKVVTEINLMNLQTNIITNLSGNPITDKRNLMKYSVKIPSTTILESYTGDIQSCPASHPYAFGSTEYGKGDKCCIGNPGRKGPDDAFDCHDYGCGTGCGHFSVACKGSSCINNNIVNTAHPYCPSTHPYPYNGGLYVSNGDTEMTYGYIESVKASHNKKNHFCCADAISQDSTICKDFVTCPSPPCYENKKTLTPTEDLKNIVDSQDISYINLVNGVWVVYTPDNKVAGINLPPNNSTHVSNFVDQSRYIQKVQKIAYSFTKPNDKNTKYYSSQITGVKNVKNKKTEYSDMYLVSTADNPGGIYIKKSTSSNKKFPINELGILYTIATDSDYYPCYSLDTRVKGIIQNKNCYGLPEFRTPISVQVDGKDVPQTKDYIDMIKKDANLLHGCFDSSNPNKKIPWVYKDGELCNGYGKYDGYICTSDPLVHSWNNMPWIKGNACTKVNAGLVYKNTGGIYRCNKNGENVKELDIETINTTTAGYSRKTLENTDDYTMSTDITSSIGGMKIYGNRYIYCLLNHVVHRYDVLSNKTFNTWEQLTNGGDYKMQFITLDNSKQNIYGISYGGNSSHIFKYNIYPSSSTDVGWRPYTTKIPALNGGIFTKIIFTVDKGDMILLDSNNNIYFNGANIYKSTNAISDIIMNGMGTHLLMLDTTNGQIIKILLSNDMKTITEDNNFNLFSVIPLVKQNNIYKNNDFMTDNNRKPDYNETPYDSYYCSLGTTSKGAKLKGCWSPTPLNSMNLGPPLHSRDAAETACNYNDSCVGFYQSDKFYLSTLDGFPPLLNPSNSDSKATKYLGVTIKKNIHDFSTQSLLLSYDGSKVYFITPKKELKYVDLRTCKISESLLPYLTGGIISITLGPDRELYAISGSSLYKITTTNMNVVSTTYTANIVLKFSKDDNDKIILCHNKPTMFVKYSNDYYYVDKESKSLTIIEKNQRTVFKQTNKPSKSPITSSFDISNSNCLYYATPIKNNYMYINKGQVYSIENIEIPDCRNFIGCNCYSSVNTPYYRQIEGQPDTFSISNMVNGEKYDNNPYIQGLDGNFTYCILSGSSDPNSCTSNNNCSTHVTSSGTICTNADIK